MVAVVTVLLYIIAGYTSTAQFVNLEPTSVTVCENENVSYTCNATARDDWRSTQFNLSFDTDTVITFINNGGCFKSLHRNSTLYDGKCGNTNGEFLFEIIRIDDRFHEQVVQCSVRYGNGGHSDTILKVKSSITIMIPIKSIVIKPSGFDQVVSVIPGENLSFTCTTNSGRPAAWIQWYINGRNMTNNATSNTTTDGSKVISASTLIYSGTSSDHNKVVYCDAGNIEGREKIRSLNKTIFIILPVTTIALDPTGDDLLSVVLGENFTFTCTTGTGRPAALIQWYIGERNLTNQAKTVTSTDNVDDTKFKSTSTLVYKGNDSTHEKVIYCEAFNTEKRPKLKTENRTVYVIVPVTSVTISPVENNKRVSVILGEKLQFICSTNLIRPKAMIHWHIGGQNMTNNATLSTIPDNTDTTKCISKSTLVYIGRDVDHNKVVYCEALNIEGRNKTRSTVTNLFIILPVSTITIKPAGTNNEVSVASGANVTFTCTTNLGRPAARIQWYIGGQNVTHQATSVTVPDNTDITKFISKSTLMYTGNDADHNKMINCEAGNAEGGKTVKTENRTLYIKVHVPNVTFEPPGGSTVVKVEVEQTHTFQCKTGPGRPAAWIHWNIGGQNMTNQASLSTAQDITDSTKLTTTSTLVYTARDADHNNVVYCEAVSTDGHKVKTTEKTLYIIVSISEITLATDTENNAVAVESAEAHTFTCRTDSGRPEARIQWYIGGQNMTNEALLSAIPDSTDNTKFISTSSLVYIGRDADHNEVVYCEAVNAEDREKLKSENETLYIIVPITQVTMLPQDVGNLVTINVGESKRFTCNTDLSRPASSIQWYISGQNVTDQAIPEIHRNGTQYLSSSTLTYIGMIRDHNQYISCEAFNIYVKDEHISEKQLIYIHSSPTTDGNQELSEKIYVGTKESLNLTVILIANPFPEVKWTFTNETAHSYNISRIDFNITSANVFRHVILYEKENPHQTDFGNYTIEAVNSIGPPFVHTFIVEPAQAPSKPFSMDAVCDLMTPRINVSWKSNFDGGKPQHFTVFLINTFTSSLIRSPIILDKGQNEIHFHTHDLDYETNYKMFVEARNTYGGVNSSELVNCTTSSQLSQEQGLSSAVIGGAAGSSAAVIVIAIMAAVVFLRRRTRKKGDDKQRLNRFNKREIKQDDDDEDELKDNPLYGTSSISTKNDVFSKVNHTQQEMKEPKVKSRNQVQKRKTKGNQKKGIELDVYENSEDFRKAFDENVIGNVNDQSASHVISPISGYQIKTNKDGLIYADLEFTPAVSGKKFFVIGSENRTNYAMIDLTKKADPLPDDSDQDGKTGSE